jgi:hypothetical protein
MVKFRKVKILLFCFLALRVAFNPSLTASASDIAYTAGLRTVENLLRVALSAVGETCYVFGGGWGEENHKIGLSQQSLNFFNQQDKSYDENLHDATKGTASRGDGWDCAAMLGWVLYNTYFCEDDILLRDFLPESTDEISYGIGGPERTFVSDCIIEDFVRRNMGQKFHFSLDKIQPGDIVHVPGHIFLVLGVCEDKSMVVSHSSVTVHGDDLSQGGSMLSATLSENGEKESEALEIVTEFMRTYAPAFHEKFARDDGTSDFCLFYSKDYGVSGERICDNILRLSGLTDDENFRYKSAAEVIGTITS